MTNLSTFLPIFFSTLALCIAVVIAWYFFTHHRILLPPVGRIGDDTEKGQEGAVVQAGDEAEAPALGNAEGGDVVDHPLADSGIPRAPTPPPGSEEGELGPVAENAAEGGEEIIEVIEDAPVAKAPPA